GDSSNDSSAESTYTMRMQMAQADKHAEIAKANVIRMWQMLARRSVDVNRVNLHAQKAIENELLALREYVQLMKTFPDTPSIMRHYALLLRDVLSDDVNANHLLRDAEVIEEEESQMHALMQNDDFNEYSGNQLSNKSNINSLSASGQSGDLDQIDLNVALGATNAGQNTSLKRLNASNIRQQQPLSPNGAATMSIIQNKGIEASTVLKQNTQTSAEEIKQRKERRRLRKILEQKRNESRQKHLKMDVTFGQLDTEGQGQQKGVMKYTTILLYSSLIAVMIVILVSFFEIKGIFSTTSTSTNNVRHYPMTPEKPIIGIRKDMNDLAGMAAWAQDMGAEIVDRYRIEITPELATIRGLTADLTVNVPYIFTEDIKNVFGDELKLIISESTRGMIIQVICMVVVAIVLFLASTLPLIMGINEVVRDRKQILKLICSLPIESATYAIEKMEQSSQEPREQQRNTLQAQPVNKSQQDGQDNDDKKDSSEQKKENSEQKKEDGVSPKVSARGRSKERDKVNEKDNKDNKLIKVYESKEVLSMMGSNNGQIMNQIMNNSNNNALDNANLQMLNQMGMNMPNATMNNNMNMNMNIMNTNQQMQGTGVMQPLMITAVSDAGITIQYADVSNLATNVNQFQGISGSLESDVVDIININAASVVIHDVANGNEPIINITIITQIRQTTPQGDQQRQKVDPQNKAKQANKQQQKGSQLPQVQQKVLLDDEGYEIDNEEDQLMDRENQNMNMNMQMQMNGMNANMNMMNFQQQQMMLMNQSFGGQAKPNKFGLHYVDLPDEEEDEEEKQYQLEQKQKQQQRQFAKSKIDNQNMNSQMLLSEQDKQEGQQEGEEDEDKKQKPKDQQKEDEPQMSPEEEERERQQQQRSEQVDDKLKSISGIVSSTLRWQLVIGTILIILSTYISFIFSLVVMKQIETISGHIGLSGWRRVTVAQIKALAIAYTYNNLFPLYEEKVGQIREERDQQPSDAYIPQFIYTDPLYTTPAITSTNFSTSRDHCREAMQKLLQLTNALGSIFMQGQSGQILSGDEIFDMINVPAAQGSDKELDEKMTGVQTCMLQDETQCFPGRIPGIEGEFYGLNELLSRLGSSLLDFLKYPLENLTDTNPDYVLVDRAADLDIQGALYWIGVYLQGDLNTFASTDSTLLLVFFLLGFFLLIVISFIFFLSVPQKLIQNQIISHRMMRFMKTKEQDIIKWSDDLAVQVGRMDFAHETLVGVLAQLVIGVQENKNASEIITTLNTIVRLTGTHFADEEMLMEEYKYPDVVKKQHWKAHIALFKKVVEFTDRLSRFKLPLAEVSLFCSTWIVDHIKGNDAELGMFLVQKGRPAHLKELPNFDILVIPNSVEDFYNTSNVSMKDKKIFEEIVARVKGIPIV
ncbi:MAG: hypothetical protein EZS28_011509, partial [Streblomastix strix]